MTPSEEILKRNRETKNTQQFALITLVFLTVFHAALVAMTLPATVPFKLEPWHLIVADLIYIFGLMFLFVME